MTIHVDGSLSVADDGRGIPVDIHPGVGKPTLEVVLTTVGAGAKFDNKAYKVSAGLHGIGAKAVTALSEWTEARSPPQRPRLHSGVRARQADHGGQGTRRSAGRPDRHDRDVHTRPGDLSRRQVRLRHAGKPPPRTGVPQQGTGHRAHDERSGKKETFHYAGRHRRVRRLSQPQRGGAAHGRSTWTRPSIEVRVEVAIAVHDRRRGTLALLRQQRLQPRRRHAPVRLPRRRHARARTPTAPRRTCSRTICSRSARTSAKA